MTMENQMMFLAAEEISKRFGGDFLAINNFTCTFKEGEIASIIGPNGAGKTTFINLLTGQLKTDSGKILFRDEEITHLSIPDRIRRGVCRSFQLTNIFSRVSVINNIKIPLVAYHKKSLRLLSRLKDDQKIQEEALRILESTGLEEKQQVLASHLSHGEQRQLEIGIALATHPRVVFLDEPTQGMNKVEKVAIMDHIVRFAEQKVATFIIIEHDMDVVFSVSQRIIVLHSGSLIADGRPDDIRKDRLVRQVYLGESL